MKRFNALLSLVAGGLLLAGTAAAQNSTTGAVVVADPNAGSNAVIVSPQSSATSNGTPATGTAQSPDASMADTGDHDAARTGNGQQFNLVDKNGDGRISRVEFNAAYPPSSDLGRSIGDFDELDRNHDSSISPNEFNASATVAPSGRP